MDNRAGKYVKNMSGELSYSSFKPTLLPLNPDISLNQNIEKELLNLSSKIAYLNGLSINIPDIDLFVTMYIRKEALLSSQIEGTQCTLEDVFDPSIDENVNLDVSDVINYIKAYEYAINRLETLPLCNRLLKEVHKVLLNNVRGQEKNPGEFRTSQNWIGGQGCTLNNARYIPPNVVDMQECMSNLEKYINSDDNTNPLIKAALIHYQFETVHPFLDGNGRIGRLLIVLYLMEKKILLTPALYISYYLKNNQGEYYDRMSRVRDNGDYEQWIEFFLRACSVACDNTVASINKLLILHKDNYSKIISNVTHRQSINVLKVFAYLEKHPIIDIGKTAEDLDLSFNTVNNAIEILMKNNIIINKRNVNRNKLFVYDEYLSILKDGTEL